MTSRPPLSTFFVVTRGQIDARSGRSPEELRTDVADADAIVVRSATKVTREVIAAAPRLRAIARAGTGVDNVDVAAATERGIVVMNAPGANSISVAELTMALVLALARKIPAADASMKVRQVGQEKFSRRRSARQGAWPGGTRTHRPGSRATRPRLRDGNDRARSVYQRACGARFAHRAGDARRACVSARTILSLHMPVDCGYATPLQCRRGWRRASVAFELINTARGELIDEGCARRRHRVGSDRRRRARRLSEGADRRSPPAEAAAGDRIAAHCRVDARGTGTGRHRDGERARRLSRPA